MGCGWLEDPAKPEPRCDAPILASSAGHPLDEIAVEGIPAHFDDHLAARVVAGGSTSLTLVARRDDGSTVLIAPIHPTGAVGGGDVTLEIVDAEGRSCAPVSFSILPLEPAPGARDAVLDRIRAHHERQAFFFRTSIEDLRALAFEDVPDLLLPLYLGQHALDDPANPNSLRALLDGSAPGLGGVSVDVELLDALLHRIGFPTALEESLEALDALVVEREAGAGALRVANSGGAGGPTTALDLHEEMQMAQWGRAHLSDRPRDKVTAAVALAVGLVGLLPSQKSKAGAFVLGNALFAFTKGAEAAAYLLPSHFVSIEFQLSVPSFRADDPSSGMWHEVEVVARSEGWKLDEALHKSVFQYVLIKNDMGDWLGKFAPNGFLETLAEYVLNQTVNEAIQDSAEGSRIVSIPPQKTGAIDITEEPWSYAEIQYTLVEDGRQGYRLRTDWDGDTMGHVVVRTARDKFGGPPTSRMKQVPVVMPRIVAAPPRATVVPGEVRVFSITVEDAYDASVSAEARHGAVELERLSDGSHQLWYTAPSSEDGLPDRIYVTSASTKGLFSIPERRPCLVIPIGDTTPSIEVAPNGICLEKGEKQMFHAAMVNLDNPGVHWSASAGTITRTGVFTAPQGEGTVAITASSVMDETVRGSASIRVGDCG